MRTKSRASWIAELYFEWKEEKQTDFPPELINSFTRNLFVEVQSDRKAAQHPIEDLVAVLENFSKIKIGKGALEIESKTKRTDS